MLTGFCKTRAVAAAIKEKDFVKAMSFRDPEFCESLDGFVAVSELDYTKKVPKEQVISIFILFMKDLH